MDQPDKPISPLQEQTGDEPIRATLQPQPAVEPLTNAAITETVSDSAESLFRRALEAVLTCETYHDERGHAFLAVPARSLNDLGAQIKFALDMHPIGSGTDSSQRSELVNGQERSAIETLLREIKKLPAMFPDDLFQAITQAEEVLKDKDLGGHESHGGRSDLEPAAPSTASHDVNSNRHDSQGGKINARIWLR
jgi:hypothetical protein